MNFYGKSLVVWKKNYFVPKNRKTKGLYSDEALKAGIVFLDNGQHGLVK